MSPDHYRIRPFRAADAPAVLRIAADTAMLGKPAESIIDDRRLFLDAMYQDYIDNESDLILVAESIDTNEVVGFVLGSADSAARERRLRRHTYPRVLLRMLTLRYRIGRKTLHAWWQILLRATWDRMPKPDVQSYPAHLHLNLDPHARGAGLGKRLLAAYLELLRERGVQGIHLTTTRRNQAACRLWEGAGFTLAARATAGAWSVLLGRPVEGRLYVLSLANARGPAPRGSE